MDRKRALASISQINISTADAHGLKNAVETYMQAVLTQIAAEDRDPDEWEGVDLMAAIGAASCGLYQLALMHVDMALTPLEDRSLERVGRRLVEGPTLSDIEHGLSELRGRQAIQRI